MGFSEKLDSGISRFLLATILMAIGFYFLAGGGGSIFVWLIGFGFILGAGILVARPLAGFAADCFLGFLRPGDRYHRKPPVYSIPESQRKNGHYQAAFDGFQKIADNYSQDLKAYLAMIDIAVVDLRDAELAESVYQRGQQALRKKQQREALSHMYEGLRTRITSAYEGPREVIAMPGRD